MKKIFGLLILALVLVGCGSGSSSVSLPGSWNITKANEDTEGVITFKEDNTFSLEHKETNVKGSYEVHYGKEAVELVGLNLETFNPTGSTNKINEKDILVIVLQFGNKDTTDGFMSDKKEDKLILYAAKKDGTTQLSGFSGISGSNYTLVKVK